MLFANTSFRRDSGLITSRFTSSDAPDFPKCGCKGSNFYPFQQIFDTDYMDFMEFFLFFLKNLPYNPYNPCFFCNFAPVFIIK